MNKPITRGNRVIGYCGENNFALPQFGHIVKLCSPEHK